jgi:hypothetical protein
LANAPKNSLFCPKNAFTRAIQLHSLQWLAFQKKAQCVYREVRLEYIYIYNVNSLYSSHFQILSKFRYTSSFRTQNSAQKLKFFAVPHSPTVHFPSLYRLFTTGPRVPGIEREPSHMCPLVSVDWIFKYSGIQRHTDPLIY